MSSVRQLGQVELFIKEGGKSRNIGFIEVQPTVSTINYINHHILLADVSGSMYGNISMLKQKILQTIQQLAKVEGNYVSIITYSGHREAKRVISGVKCDEMSYGMANIYDVVERELYTKSVTVMSEPLEQSIEITKALANICNKHHIALFTDGCLVPTSWSTATEREKCFDIAEICKKENIFLNAIGFGQYYDRSFLKELINRAGNGAVVHIDEVKNYTDAILGMISKVNNEAIVSVDVEAIGGSLFNISNSTMGNKLNIKNFDNSKPMIIACIDCNSVLVNGETISLDKSLHAGMLTSDDFCYSLAKYYMNEEDVDNAEFVIKALGDVALYEAIQDSYSFIEKGNAVNKINSALEDVANRFAEGRVPQIDNSNEKMCVLEILQAIIEDDDSDLFWDVNTPYHRIGQKKMVGESNISFKQSDAGLMPVISLSVGSEKLNIGIKVKVAGTVTDKISGLAREAYIFKDLNIINGGNINVPYLNAKLSQDLYNKFKDEGILELPMGLRSYIPTNVYTINLQGIKSANKKLLKSMSMSDIGQTLYDIADMKCKQWALNQLIKQVTNLEGGKLSFSNLTPEEQAVRATLRLDEFGLYTPESVSLDDNSPFEIYPAIFMTWDIAKFPETKTKENYSNDLTNRIKNNNMVIGKNNQVIYEFLDGELKALKKQMRNAEFKANAVRIASAITGKAPFMWEDVEEKDKKTNDKILNQNMVVNGKVAISRKKVNDNIVEQKKWLQLIKCN